jgi:hypothetical protein
MSMWHVFPCNCRFPRVVKRCVDIIFSPEKMLKFLPEPDARRCTPRCDFGRLPFWPRIWAFVGPRGGRTRTKWWRDTVRRRTQTDLGEWKCFFSQNAELLHVFFFFFRRDEAWTECMTPNDYCPPWTVWVAKQEANIYFQARFVEKWQARHERPRPDYVKLKTRIFSLIRSSINSFQRPL